MDRGSIIGLLKDFEPELRAEGINHLLLFGSMARGDNTENSDIDLIAEFEGSKRRTVITIVRLENRLSEMLGAKVDLSSAQTLKQSVRDRAMREAVHAF